MTLHTTVGLVTMAAALLVSGHGQAASAAGHVHGPSSGTLLVAVLTGCLSYAVWSAASALRARPPLDRAQYAAMGASVLLMAAAMAL